MINAMNKTLLSAFSFMFMILASQVSIADTNPFGISANTGSSVQMAEGMKCAAGKCGANMKKGKAAKCGDSMKKKASKCGDSMKKKDGKCGDSMKKKAKEGKCGASHMKEKGGKCSGEMMDKSKAPMKKKNGKCGTGKCGANKNR